jgi:hypothetical protein
MELKSPDKIFNLLFALADRRGLGMIVAGHASFGTTLWAAGCCFWHCRCSGQRAK